MESSAAIRSFHYAIGTMSHMRSSLEKPAVVSCHNVRSNCNIGPFIQRLANGQKHINSHTNGKKTLVSCSKTVEAISTTKSDASSDITEKKALQNSTFPNGIEALVLEVCDETEIAEIKLKVGEFEMHLKRNVGATTAPLSNISPTTLPPIPSEPMDESAPATPQPLPPKSTSENNNPFPIVAQKSSKLVALEASGTNTHVLIKSSEVGVFKRGRTVKGKLRPPTCKEGDIIKEGHVIGYAYQLGKQLPLTSAVAGEVVKLLVEDEDAVGYGDPIAAVLPSFHDIK